MKRIDSIDFAKGIAIIAVTLGHILGSFQIRGSLFIWVYSFELPLFFLVSGLLNGIKQKDCTFKEMIAHQAQSILIPYIEFSLVYILIDAAIGVIKGDLVTKLLFDLGYTLSGLGLGAIWFLPTFFLSSILANCACKIATGSKVGGGTAELDYSFAGYLYGDVQRKIWIYSEDELS